MEKVKINEIECLFTEDPEIECPDGYYHKYYIRHTDTDFIPATVEKFVLVNRYGVIFTKEPFHLLEDGTEEYVEIISFIDEDGNEII